MPAIAIPFELDISKPWQTVTGIDYDNDLIALAKKIGDIRKTSSGDSISQISPKSTNEARPNTFGARFGMGRYPFHTDTAHLTIPVRYLVMKVEGVTDRPTNLAKVSDIVERLSSDELRLFKESVWYSGSSGSRFTCSLMLKYKGNGCFRYDPVCMKPANHAALECRTILSKIDQEIDFYEHEWRPNEALVISNWQCMHGRGVSGSDFEDRTLKRIYVD